MANLPLPDKGQPMDVKFLYSMAAEINNLSTQMASSSNKYTDITIPGSGTHEMLTGDARMSGAFIDISAPGVSQGNRVAFQYQLKAGFKYTPIVTATCVTGTNNEVSRSAYPVINSITTRLVKGEVICNYSGDLRVNVNIIAIGVPE